ncbi:unnamed protein product [Symbiodinium sp. KB8]|nr:unnamed protein product [Symbiodinium sp. KB8]
MELPKMVKYNEGEATPSLTPLHLHRKTLAGLPALLLKASAQPIDFAVPSESMLTVLSDVTLVLAHRWSRSLRTWRIRRGMRDLVFGEPGSIGLDFEEPVLEGTDGALTSTWKLRATHPPASALKMENGSELVAINRIRVTERTPRSEVARRISSRPVSLTFRLPACAKVVDKIEIFPMVRHADAHHVESRYPSLISKFQLFTHTMAGSSPRRRLARLLCAAALTAAALLMSWKPRCGSAVAFGLSALGLLADGLTYRQGATVYWPKILDAALALLWAALALLLSFTKCSWLRLYAGVVILGALCFVSCVSTCMQVPWVLQVAVDHVDPELMSPMSLPSSTRRKVFRQACAVVTMYWALVFAGMAVGVAANSLCNTGVSSDGQTLVHESQWVNVLLGGCWPACFLVVGACTSARLGKYVTSRLLAQYE